MSHYSRRPSPPSEPLSLGSGDFEAVFERSSGGSLGGSNLAIPRPPRTPIFHRSAAPEAPQRFGFGPGTYPAHYSQAPAAPPAAPHSLSPMAMSAHSANGTGPQQQQRVAETVVIRSRPNIRTGFSILLAGALIGGVIGITMRMRQNDADAAVAAAQHAEDDQQQASLANVNDMPRATTPAAAPSPPAATVMAPEAPVAPTFYFPPTTVPAPAAAPAAHHASPAPKKHVRVAFGHGGGHPSISAKVSAPKEKDDGYKEPKNPNAEPAKEAKVERPKEREAPKDPPKRSKGGRADDAEKVLKAAMGATENTL